MKSQETLKHYSSGWNFDYLSSWQTGRAVYQPVALQSLDIQFLHSNSMLGLLEDVFSSVHRDLRISL